MITYTEQPTETADMTINSTNNNQNDDTLELPRRLTDEELDELGGAIYDAILQSEGIHTTVDVEATEVEVAGTYVVDDRLVDNTQQDDVQ